MSSRGCHPGGHSLKSPQALRQWLGDQCPPVRPGLPPSHRPQSDRGLSERKQKVGRFGQCLIPEPEDSSLPQGSVRGPGDHRPHSNGHPGPAAFGPQLHSTETQRDKPSQSPGFPDSCDDEKGICWPGLQMLESGLPLGHRPPRPYPAPEADSSTGLLGAQHNSASACGHRRLFPEGSRRWLADLGWQAPRGWGSRLPSQTPATLR